MTYPSFSFPAFLNWRDALCVLAWIVSFTLSPVWAGPGAHGPNGEHLDTPLASSGPSADSAPRFEAQTELFEVVGRLQGGELSLLIDRFETNEPVLKAMVEVASGAVTAQARRACPMAASTCPRRAPRAAMAHGHPHGAGPETEAAATVELPGRVVAGPERQRRVQAVHGGRIEPGPRACRWRARP
jgi:hypothetical protein